MTRKYKQAAKRRNKRAVQKYRTATNYWQGVDYGYPESFWQPLKRARHQGPWWQRIIKLFKA